MNCFKALNDYDAISFTDLILLDGKVLMARDLIQQNLDIVNAIHNTFNRDCPLL